MHYRSAELGALDAVLAAPSDERVRLDYARLLADQGELARAAIIEGTVSARLGRGTRVLGEALAELPPASQGWARLVGARLAFEMSERGLDDRIARWMALARPALELVVEESAEVTRSRLGGDPDLPHGYTWPTLGDCQRWQPNIELDPSSSCQFVGQLDLAELHASPAARGLPRAGLLSVFAHHEWKTTGSAGICVRYFPDTSALERAPHAETDADNRRTRARSVRWTEALTIPEIGGLTDLGDTSDEISDLHREILEASGGGLLGLLGHLRATTGDDPTPGPDWLRLVCLPIDEDAVVIHHLAIRGDDLSAGRLDRGALVWVDFDGA